MSLTRDQINTILIARCGALLKAANLTTNGLMDDLNAPIAWALRQRGFSTADPTSPTPTEVSAVSGAAIDPVLDYAELAALRAALTNYVAVDQTAEGQSARDDQLRKAMQDAIDRKETQIKTAYPPTANTQIASLTGGTIALSFQETNANAA